MTPDRRDELIVTTCFLGSAAAGVGLAATYALGGNTQVEGLLLGLALVGIAFGLILWSHRLLPTEPFVSERGELASPAEVDEEVAEVLERGGLTRRKAIGRSLGLAVAAIGAGLALPVRSLGPSPGRALLETPWGAGRRKLVTSDGRPVQAASVPMDGLVTVFPEGKPGSADGQAVLMRVDPALLRPCHQSTFAVLDGAKPLVGPAAVALPQLPLAIDPDGTVVSTGEFSDPVGPGFWHRT